MEKIRRRQFNVLKDKKILEKSLIDIDKRLEKVGIEENRLLDAYRAGAITLEQLKEQMAKIQEKKEGLAKEKESITYKLSQVMPSGLIRRDIKGYCKTVSSRLTNATFEQKRHIVRIIRRIVIDEDKVRIKAIIPRNPPISNIVSTTSY